MGMTVRIGGTVLRTAAGTAISNMLNGVFLPDDAAGIVVDAGNPLVGRPQQPIIIEMKNVYAGASEPIADIRIDPERLAVVRSSRFSDQWVLSEGSQRYVHQVRTYAGAQAALLARGYSPGRVDGKWGPKSRAALRRFQNAQSLSATGELDQLTEARLLGY